MLDLSAKTLAAWKQKLPDDVLTAIPADDAVLIGPAEAAALVQEIDNAHPAAIPGILFRNEENLKALGRTGRLRLMANLSNIVKPEASSLFFLLVEDESDSSAGAASVRILLLEDIKAFMKAIAHRLGSHYLSEANFQQALQAAYTFEGDMTMARGPQ